MLREDSERLLLAAFRIVISTSTVCLHNYNTVWPVIHNVGKIMVVTDDTSPITHGQGSFFTTTVDQWVEWLPP